MAIGIQLYSVQICIFRMFVCQNKFYDGTTDFSQQVRLKKKRYKLVRGPPFLNVNSVLVRCLNNLEDRLVEYLLYFFFGGILT